MHDTLPAIVLLIAVISGILLDCRRFRGLEAKLDAIERDMRNRRPEF